MSEFNYHLELTPQQLKITYTALKSLLDDFGHDEAEVVKLIHEVLEKLPDEHSVRAIAIGEKTEAQPGGSDPDEGPAGPPAAA